MIRLYRRHLFREWLGDKEGTLARLRTLYGKKLVCWCEPLACHGDVLVAGAEYAHAKSLREPVPSSDGYSPGPDKNERSEDILRDERD